MLSFVLAATFAAAPPVDRIELPEVHATIELPKPEATLYSVCVLDSAAENDAVAKGKCDDDVVKLVKGPRPPGVARVLMVVWATEDGASSVTVSLFPSEKVATTDDLKQLVGDVDAAFDKRGPVTTRAPLEGYRVVRAQPSTLASFTRFEGSAISEFYVATDGTSSVVTVQAELDEKSVGPLQGSVDAIAASIQFAIATPVVDGARSTSATTGANDAANHNANGAGGDGGAGKRFPIPARIIGIVLAAAFGAAFAQWARKRPRAQGPRP